MTQSKMVRIGGVYLMDGAHAVTPHLLESLKYALKSTSTKCHASQCISQSCAAPRNAGRYCSVFSSMEMWTARPRGPPHSHRQGRAYRVISWICTFVGLGE